VIEPDRYAVIGNPVAHSKSPDIHAHFAVQTQQALTYERLLAPLDGFTATVRAFQQQGGRGANITVPFKLQAYELATRLTLRAQAAGAVNTLTFEGDVIVGDNTDGVGLVTDLMQNAALSILGRRILLLGAGGAARGVVLSLLDQHPAQLVIVNRTLSKAQALAQQFAQHGQVHACDFSALSGCFDIVINATAASLAAQMPPVPPSVFGPHTLAYDMMYGRQPSAFMRLAQQHGATTRDGLGMLVEQAAEAFEVWRGVRPDTAEIYEKLREAA